MRPPWRSFADEEFEALATALRNALIDYNVRVAPLIPSCGEPLASPGLQELMNPVQSIGIDVPLDALSGAVATICLNRVRDWLANYYLSRKEIRCSIKE